MVVTRSSKREVSRINLRRDIFDVRIGEWSMFRETDLTKSITCGISTDFDNTKSVLFRGEKKAFKEEFNNNNMVEFNHALFNGISKEFNRDLLSFDLKEDSQEFNRYKSIPPGLDNAENKLLYNMYFPQSIIQMDKIEVLKNTSSDEQIYFKSRFHNSFMRKYQQFLLKLLPFGFCFSDFQQLPIIFYSTNESICETHYDRDNSILYVVNGKKEVLLNNSKNVLKHYPMAMENNTLSGYYENVRPFEETKEERETHGWKCCVLSPGDSLYIPKNVIHCVKSERQTLAVSYQVTTEIRGHRALASQKQYVSMINYLNKE